MPYIGNQPVAGDSTTSFRLLDSISSFTETFDGSSSSVVSTGSDTITIASHRFITGQRVTYATTGTEIGNLTSGNVYYIIREDVNTIKLADSLSDANSNIPRDLTGLGVGSTHTLNVAFDGVNTKFKASYNNGTFVKLTRAAQLMLSINGVIQQPFDTATPSNGFGFDLNSVIVFSTPPAVSDVFWGTVISNTFVTFDISDNVVDNFTGDGTSTSFTLSKKPINNENVLVTIDGVVQYPSDNTTTRAYSVTEYDLIFTSPPSDSTDIQARHIGFAGASTGGVTGFYGRTGNVGLTTNDTVSIGNATIGVGAAGTALLVRGDARVTGILSIGQGTVTIDGDTNTVTASNIIVQNSLVTADNVGYATTGFVTNSLVGYATEGYVNNLVAISTFSGDYNDLANQPSIPSIVGLASEGYVNNLVAISTFSGDYNDLANQPSIPSIVGLASEGYVTQQITNLVDEAPGALDTLNELAAALNDDASFSTTVTNSLAQKANLSGANFTGVVTATSFSGDGSQLTGVGGFNAIGFFLN
jgi:hypothetical protein